MPNAQHIVNLRPLWLDWVPSDTVRTCISKLEDNGECDMEDMSGLSSVLSDVLGVSAVVFALCLIAFGASLIRGGKGEPAVEKRSKRLRRAFLIQILGAGMMGCSATSQLLDKGVVDFVVGCGIGCCALALAMAVFTTYQLSRHKQEAREETQ